MLIACPACHRQFDAGPHAAGARLRCHCGTVMTVPEARAHDVRMVHCSACGAGLPHGATSCGFCGAGVGLAQKGLGENCPSCLTRLVAGARYCSSCGTAIAPEAVHHALADHDCPRCRGPLTNSTLGDVGYEQCTTCGGLWLDEALVERLVRARGDARPALPASLAHLGGPPPADAVRTAPPGTATTYIPCPVCTQMMHRRNFAGRSGVIVDHCKGHGYWFDAEELEHILTFVDAGGLELARDRELRDVEARQKESRAAARRATEILPRSRRERGLGAKIPWLDAVADFLATLLDR